MRRQLSCVASGFVEIEASWCGSRKLRGWGKSYIEGRVKASGLACDWPERGSANAEATGKEAGRWPTAPADKEAIWVPPHLQILALQVPSFATVWKKLM